MTQSQHIQPIPKTMQASDVRNKWREIANEVHRGKTRIIVEKHGLPMVALISVDDLDWFAMLEARLAQDEPEQFATLKVARQKQLKKLDETEEVIREIFPEEIERMERVLEKMRRELRRLQRMYGDREV